MKPRILAIDDEEIWLKTFSTCIPRDLAEQDSAISTDTARDLLRRRRYHAVLLDLSMEIGDTRNRANRGIQEYLSTHPDGTNYIIISANVDLQETIDAAFHLNASYVFEKDKIELGVLREKVRQAVNHAAKEDNRILADARRELTQGGRLEDQILSILRPTGGAAGMYPMMDALFDRIAPIVPHRDRPHLEFLQDSVAALVWSRQLGKAVSIILANRKASEETSTAQLAGWLGYPQNQPPILTRDVGGVRLQYFGEPNISDIHFNLPMIATDD